MDEKSKNHKMKQLMHKIVDSIIYLWAKIYSYQTSQKIRRKKNAIYSCWIRSEFNKIGTDCFIAKPIYLTGGKHITIGDHFGCDQRLRLDAYDEFLGELFKPQIIIGNNVSIQKDCHIGAIDKITIGNNVLLGSKVYISDHSHGKISKETLSLPPALRSLYSKGEIIIEDNVWLGEGVVVLPNVTIGENSIIGANAVVTKSIPKNSIAAGNPARVIKTL